MMVGPPRPEDHENVIEGHGLLLAPAHPPVAARQRRARRRVRRQLAEGGIASRLEQLRSWPVEFDHLLMGPANENEKKPQQENKASMPASVLSSSSSNEERRKVLKISRINATNTRPELVNSTLSSQEVPKSLEKR